MIEYALKCLKEQYDNNKISPKEADIYQLWYKEKWRHSLQVFGAGNMLVRHIDWLQDKSANFLETVRTAVLLHDIYRFKEIALLINENKKIDHGVEGAKFLQTIDMFNDIKIWLPIKHHGHLIEKLYADEQYQNIQDKTLKKECELICFLVRDADKIANLRMLANEPEMRPLFLSEGIGNPLHDYSISDFAKKEVFAGKTVSRSFKCTIADRMLGYLSWFNDINYRYSVDFCLKLNIVEKLKDYFAQICNDKEFVEEYFAYFDECLRNKDFLA